MCGSTFLLAITKTDGSISVDLREKRKTPFPLSLSLSLSSHSLPVCAKKWHFPSFCLTFLISFTFLYFSIFFLFDFFLLVSFLTFFFHILIPPNSPIYFTPNPFKFSFFFFILPFDFLFLFSPYFLLFPSFDIWLNVSHSLKCTTWLMPCVTQHLVPRKT